MTSQDLRAIVNDKILSLDRIPPRTILVDTDTYAHVCVTVVSWAMERGIYTEGSGCSFVMFAVGPNQGVMFKGIELVLEGPADVKLADIVK